MSVISRRNNLYTLVVCRLLLLSFKNRYCIMNSNFICLVSLSISFHCMSPPFGCLLYFIDFSIPLSNLSHCLVYFFVFFFWLCPLKINLLIISFFLLFPPFHCFFHSLVSPRHYHSQSAISLSFPFNFSARSRESSLSLSTPFH